VTSNTGLKARLARPLDFLVITDHAENLGLPVAITQKDPILASIPWGREMIETTEPGTIESMIAGYEKWMQELFAGTDPLGPVEIHLEFITAAPM
jgi:hypothetical protein